LLGDADFINLYQKFGLKASPFQRGFDGRVFWVGNLGSGGSQALRESGNLAAETRAEFGKGRAAKISNHLASGLNPSESSEKSGLFCLSMGRRASTNSRFNILVRPER
jgi:hypothetical protein